MMTMVPRTRTITPEMISASSMLVRIAHQADPSIGRALAKAEERLLILPWTVDCGILQIASHSDPTKCHETDGETCHCPTTRGTCWHIAAFLILSAIAAAGINPIAARPLLRVVLDKNTEDYPDNFLDLNFADEDTVGVTTNNHDEYGDVIPELPAFEEVDELLPFSRRSRSDRKAA